VVVVDIVFECFIVAGWSRGLGLDFAVGVLLLVLLESLGGYKRIQYWLTLVGWAGRLGLQMRVGEIGRVQMHHDPTNTAALTWCSQPSGMKSASPGCSVTVSACRSAWL